MAVEKCWLVYSLRWKRERRERGRRNWVERPVLVT